MHTPPRRRVPEQGEPRSKHGRRLAQPRPLRSSTGRRVVVLAALALAILGLLAGPAAAHPALVSSEPAAGYALEQAPDQLLLRFSEPVQTAALPLQLLDGDDRVLPLLVTQEEGGAVLRGAPEGELTEGQYTMRYDVVAQDGDVVRGDVRFAVGVAAATDAGSPAPAPGVTGDLVLPRALLFAGLALALGGAVAAWNAGRVTAGRPGVRPLQRTGGLIAATGAAAQLAVLGGGGLGRVADLLAAPGPARLLLVQLALLLLVAVLPAVRGLQPWSLAGLVGVVLLEGLRAHPGKVGGAAGMTLTVVHLLAASVWVGGLVHVLRLAVRWRGTPEPLRAVVSSYARTALILVGVVAVTGTANALLLLPSMRDLVGTAYGQVLLGKLALFLAVVGAAGIARAWLRRRGGGAPLARSARVEAGLLALVLVVTGALTSATPARLVPASAAALTAPTGPVLRIAERAQQVTVAVVVSEGRLDLRTDVPDDSTPVRYRVEATVRASAGTVMRPALRGCGTACWTAEVSWPPGSSELAVDVTAEPWEAGRVTMPVEWPPTPGAEVLDRVRATMAAVPAVETMETVTSGFGVDVPSTSVRTGQQYLDAQSWPAGGATDVVLVQEDERRTLVFALPALGYHFRLGIDAQDRVVAERIVTPNHLLVRSYRYPAAG